MTTTHQSLRVRLAAIWADMTNAHAAIGRITPGEESALPTNRDAR